MEYLKLLADKLKNDKRVLEAKRLLKEALAEHQSSITGLRPANPDLQSAYEILVKQMADLRGRALVYPYLSSGIGKGALVVLADGSVKYDFITGIGVHFFFHSHS